MPEPKRSPLTQSDRPTAFSAVAGLAQTVTNADVKGKSLETSGDQVAGGAIGQAAHQSRRSSNGDQTE